MLIVVPAVVLAGDPLLERLPAPGLALLRQTCRALVDPAEPYLAAAVLAHHWRVKRMCDELARRRHSDDTAEGTLYHVRHAPGASAIASPRFTPAHTLQEVRRAVMCGGSNGFQKAHCVHHAVPRGVLPLVTDVRGFLEQLCEVDRAIMDGDEPATLRQVMGRLRGVVQGASLAQMRTLRDHVLPGWLERLPLWSALRAAVVLTCLTDNS